MKVISVPKTNYDAGSCKNNVQRASVNLSDTPNDSVSFKGVKCSGFKDKLTGMFKEIDKRGFFVEFLIVDTISMILPRVGVGLYRDRDKTGEYNYKAALEEGGREILSGPSMNIIPMGVLAAISSLKPASHMGKETITAFTQNMKTVLDSSYSHSGITKDEANKKLAEQLFEDSFGGFKFKTKETADGFKQDFVDSLVHSTTLKKKMLNNEAFNANATAFQELIIEINNQGNSKNGAPLNENNVKLGINPKDGKKLSNISGKELYEDFHNYSKDALQKLVDYKPSEPTIDNAKKFLEKIEQRSIGIKTASAVAAFFAVGGFLLYLPKIYQQGNVSPAEESAKRAKAGVEGGTNENK